MQNNSGHSIRVEDRASDKVGEMVGRMGEIACYQLMVALQFLGMGWEISHVLDCSCYEDRDWIKALAKKEPRDVVDVADQRIRSAVAPKGMLRNSRTTI